jgi:hypothetical protein
MLFRSCMSTAGCRLLALELRYDRVLVASADRAKCGVYQEALQRDLLLCVRLRCGCQGSVVLHSPRQTLRRIQHTILPRTLVERYSAASGARSPRFTADAHRRGARPATRTREAGRAGRARRVTLRVYPARPAGAAGRALAAEAGPVAGAQMCAAPQPGQGRRAGPGWAGPGRAGPGAQESRSMRS